MVDRPTLRLPETASPDEAAAIAAAVERLLAAEAGPDPWSGRRFAFAGRLEKLGRAPARVPAGAPADPWTAAGRRRRF